MSERAARAALSPILAVHHILVATRRGTRIARPDPSRVPSEDEIAAWLRAIRIESMGADEDGLDEQDREAAHRAKEW